MLQSKYISGPALFFITAAVTLTLFFELWRFLFILALNEKAAGVPPGVLLKAFVIGLRFDFSITSYIVLPLFILSVIPFIDIQRNRFVRSFISYLFIVLTAAAFFLHLVDIEFTRAFYARLNDFLFYWGGAPLAVIPHLWNVLSAIVYTVLFVIVLAVFIRLVKLLLNKTVIDRPRSPFWINLAYLPLVLVIFGLGARGRLAEEPMRWGMAYFSQYDFANLAALNPVYTFTLDAFYNRREKVETEKLMAEINNDRAESTARELLGMPPNSEDNRLIRPVRFEPPNDNPPNVILIIMESFGATKIGALDNRFPYDLTPQFDSLAVHGTLFTNFYSCGERTFACLAAALYGSPPGYGKLIVKQVPGENHLQGLPSILKNYGYQTSCFVTTDPHFDNMHGFLMSNGVMKVYSMYDIGEDKALSWMGVPDHVMFDFAYKKLRQKNNRPFFATLLTASNHGPWLLPEVDFGRLPDSVEDAHKLNAFKYSDWALGRFVDQISNDTAFDNTLIVITADNGSPYKQKNDLEITHYQIPLLILSTDGDFKKVCDSARTASRLGSQLDILATVMGLLRLDYDNYSFGKDLFDTSYTGTDFAHFVERDLIGHIENCFFLINRLHGKESLYKLPDDSTDLSDSLRDMVEEHKRKSEAIFQTAYHNMKRPLR
ncbi:MAG: sulfatase-like hydrolase/transferase [candidate division Zixibacteria bacterium]|nr:sulfatase-like hydrolase/transferase [candidate division Zixibacteria bacterium]